MNNELSVLYSASAMGRGRARSCIFMHTYLQIVTLEKKVDALEKLYGCQLVWKIEQWADKVHEAKLGRKSTLFSPPFLTSRHGYKMAMSLCPYGDGKGRQSILFRTQ